MNKDDLKSKLASGLVKVKFTKVNGEERTMVCTLNDEIVPPATKEDPLTQKKVRAVNEEVQVVYDVEKDGWRSFRWDNLVEYNVH